MNPCSPFHADPHFSRQGVAQQVGYLVPEDHAVHFLIELNLAGGETHAFGHSERRTISLRVVLQARIESEIGLFRGPMPVLDDYEAFDAIRHGALPDKQRQVFNPFKNESVPYWVVKEVAV